MKLKSEANEALSPFFQQFHRKLKDSLCLLRQTEPSTQWLNAAKNVMKELKTASVRKMVNSSAWKRYWDDCLKPESYITSNTAHGTYKLGGEILKTSMSGKTSNASQFCGLEWCEWVMFQHKVAPYPNEHVKHGRPGAKHYVGPAMTARILNETSQVLHGSMYWVLTWDEWDRGKCKDKCRSFMESLNQRLGCQVAVDDLVDLGIEDVTI